MDAHSENPSAFISHSSIDKTFVRRLAQDLLANGITAWVDEAEIRPGDDFISRIENGLQKASHVIIVLSPRSLLSGWVREEIHAAQIRAIQGTAKVVPLLLGNVSIDEIPLLLKSKLYCDFRDPSSYSTQFQELLRVFSVSDNATPASKILLPVIEDMNILCGSSRSEYALEIVVNNPSPDKLLFRRVVIGARRWEPCLRCGEPPSFIYEFDVDVVPSSLTTHATLHGTARSHGDHWGRQLEGYCVLHDNDAKFELSAPFFCEFAPRERGILRFLIRKPSIGKQDSSLGSFWSNRFANEDFLLNSTAFTDRKMDFAEQIILAFGGDQNVTWIILDGDIEEPVAASLVDDRLLKLFEPKLRRRSAIRRWLGLFRLFFCRFLGGFRR